MTNNHTYIKKKFEEENIIYYLHFLDKNAVRQIEFNNHSYKYLDISISNVGDSMLYDQKIDELNIQHSDNFSKKEFEMLWDKRPKPKNLTLIKEGDIFNIEYSKNYVHGCNCAGAMGKGIALTFKDKFPEMFLEYRNICKDGLFKLGDVFMYKYNGGHIFNLGTQRTWREKADIFAVSKSLNTMFKLCKNKGIKNIAMPKIASGLGGLDWHLVKSTIESTCTNFPEVDVYVVEAYKKKNL